MPGHGRFAPSPSAELHLGNLRTALLAFLAARSSGSRFMLRIDDLDRGRAREEIERRQLEDLAALGLEHDGAVPRQSERLPRYLAAFEQLSEGGELYPCFCTRAEIRDASRAPHGVPTAGYPGTCRQLSVAQRTAREQDGRRPAWRLKADPAPMLIEDQVLGTLQLHAEDVVLRRADGEFGYQLAVVLDDADQGVTDVVRGADLVDSCATQRSLQRLLRLPLTSYAHVPLMLGPDGQRLAKRHGAATLSDVVGGRQSFSLPGLPAGTSASPTQLRGALAATVGLASAGETPTLDELVDRFAYDAIATGSTMMQ